MNIPETRSLYSIRRRVYRTETKLASREELCNLPATHPNVRMAGTRSASLPETHILCPTRTHVPGVERHIRVRQTRFPRGLLATNNRCLADTTKQRSNPKAMTWHAAGVLSIADRLALDVVRQLRLGLDPIAHPRHSAVGC